MLSASPCEAASAVARSPHGSSDSGGTTGHPAQAAEADVTMQDLPSSDGDAAARVEEDVTAQCTTLVLVSDCANCHGNHMFAHTCSKRRGANKRAAASMNGSGRASRSRTTQADAPPVIHPPTDASLAGADASAAASVASGSASAPSDAMDTDDGRPQQREPTHALACLPGESSSTFVFRRLLGRSVCEDSEDFTYHLEGADGDMRDATYAEAKLLPIKAGTDEPEWSCSCCSAKGWSLDRTKICLGCGALSPADDLALAEAKKAAPRTALR